MKHAQSLVDQFSGEVSGQGSFKVELCKCQGCPNPPIPPYDMCEGCFQAGQRFGFIVDRNNIAQVCTKKRRKCR